MYYPTFLKAVMAILAAHRVAGVDPFEVSRVDTSQTYEVSISGISLGFIDTVSGGAFAVRLENA